MGKKLALLLMVILVVVSLPACSGSKEKKTESGGESNRTEDEKIFEAALPSLMNCLIWKIRL